MTDHNHALKRQARWHATKLILIYFSILAALLVIGYIDLFYLFVGAGAMFGIMIASAIYRDAYYSKLLELNKGRWDVQD